MNLNAPFQRRSDRPGEDDLGFGTRITSRERLIRKDGSYNIIRNGQRSVSPYQMMVEIHWPGFFAWVIGAYIFLNLLFALLFVWNGVEDISGIRPDTFGGQFAQAFFFSIQTFTTVGYGAMSPNGAMANVIASSCALVGLLSFSLVTGLFFAKFSKPRPQVLFSRHAIIAPFGEGKALMFRMANKRNNRILNLKATFFMTWVDEHPSKVRRYAPLPIERDQISMLPLNWTVVHVLDEESPLSGKTAEELERINAEFLVMIEGHDESYNQVIHAHASYGWEELKWGYRFAPMYEADAWGRTILQLGLIDELIPEGDQR